MQIDQNPFQVHAIELQNPKVLIRSNQVKSTKVKNIIIGEKRSEPLKWEKKVAVKKTPEVSLNNLALGGQDQNRSTRSAKTGLTYLKTDLPVNLEILQKVLKIGRRGGQGLKNS